MHPDHRKMGLAAELAIQVVPIGAPTASEIAAAESGLAALAAEFGVRIEMSLVDDIAPAPSGKHHPYIPLAARAQ